MSIDELFEGIKDFFDGCFEWLGDKISPGVDIVLDLIGSLFTTVFKWLFDFIFLNFFDSLSDFGVTFFDNVGSSVSSTVANGTFIFIVVGALISFPLLKIVIGIIRG